MGWVRSKTSSTCSPLLRSSTASGARGWPDSRRISRARPAACHRPATRRRHVVAAASAWLAPAMGKASSRNTRARATTRAPRPGHSPPAGGSDPHRVGAVERVIEAAPARIGGVQRIARIGDRHHQLRPRPPWRSPGRHSRSRSRNPRPRERGSRSPPETPCRTVFNGRDRENPAPPQPCGQSF
jgi:hypothetical protein